MRYFEDVYTANPRPYGDTPSEAAKALAGHLAKTKQGTFTLDNTSLAFGIAPSCMPSRLAISARGSIDKI